MIGSLRTSSPEGAYNAKKKVCPKMTQNMLSVRIPFKHEIADDGMFVSKICDAFFLNEKQSKTSRQTFPVKRRKILSLKIKIYWLSLLKGYIYKK